LVILGSVVIASFLPMGAGRARSEEVFQGKDRLTEHLSRLQSPLHRRAWTPINFAGQFDAHLYRAFAVQDGDRHDGAVFGEGQRELALSAAARL
jgi:hypothetical protein